MPDLQVLGFLMFSNLLCAAVGYSLGRLNRRDHLRED